MSSIPADLKYTTEHEWLLVLADGKARIGITDYAQQSLGDVTFAELPSVGASYAQGETFGVVESVKAASDLYMPVAGTVTAINEQLSDSPELLNSDPYGAAWVIEIQMDTPADVDGLLSAEAYGEIVG